MERQMACPLWSGLRRSGSDDHNWGRLVEVARQSLDSGDRGWGLLADEEVQIVGTNLGCCVEDVRPAGP